MEHLLPEELQSSRKRRQLRAAIVAPTCWSQPHTLPALPQRCMAQEVVAAARDLLEAAWQSDTAQCTGAAAAAARGLYLEAWWMVVDSCK